MKKIKEFLLQGDESIFEVDCAFVVKLLAVALCVHDALDHLLYRVWLLTVQVLARPVLCRFRTELETLSTESEFLMGFLDPRLPVEFGSRSYRILFFFDT